MITPCGISIQSEEEAAVKKVQNKLIYACILGFFTLAFCGCTFSGINEKSEPKGEQKNTGFVMTGPGSYDSADTAIITNIDTQKSTITFYNMDLEKKYTLNFDGATVYLDKYEQGISLAQLTEGDIVDIKFLKSKKRLDKLCFSAESWKNESVEKYEINWSRKDVTIGTDIYKFTSDTLIFSDGEQIEKMDLNNVDILTFQGIGSTVQSVQVVKGHGYLRLANDENFIGGWIELGQSYIKKISEEMLLTVPEGKYEVFISYKGNNGIKNVIINRNEEITLDIGDLKVAEPQFGQVLFATSPSTASVYVDGEKVDISSAVNLSYGIHQLIATADGYSTITSYFRVAQPSAGLEVTLESSSSEDEGSSTNTSNTSSTTTSYYKVYIDGPDDAEVYVDGSYVGISPISFKKEEGAHIITLRRTGYETRSYTIQVDSEEKDISFAFAELIETTSE